MKYKTFNFIFAIFALIVYHLYSVFIIEFCKTKYEKH